MKEKQFFNGKQGNKVKILIGWPHKHIWCTESLSISYIPFWYGDLIWFLILIVFSKLLWLTSQTLVIMKLGVEKMRCLTS